MTHPNHLLRPLLTVALIGLVACHPGPEVAESTIGIQPYGAVDPALLDTLQATLERVYAPAHVVILPSVELPASAFIEVKSPRYRADSLIAQQTRHRPDSIDFVLGVLNRDISTTKRDPHGAVLDPAWKYADWGVFGLGYRPGVSCVVSTFRVGSVSKRLFMERMKKIAVHEVGHNLGLPHCTAGGRCVMRDAAESIRTIDRVDLALCDRCKSRIAPTLDP